MIDLSSLQIPPADVVPEPTAEDVKRINTTLKLVGKHDHGMIERVLCSLARRCRELEAEVERLRDAKLTDAYERSPE